jgi:hypothetical protein
MFYMSVALSQKVQKAEDLLRVSRNFLPFIEPEVLLSVLLVSTLSHANPVHYFAYYFFNPLNADLNPICHLLALLGAHPILHISRIRVKVHFIIILQYSLMSYMWSLLFRFPYQNVISISHISHANYVH